MPSTELQKDIRKYLKTHGPSLFEDIQTGISLPGFKLVPNFEISHTLRNMHEEGMAFLEDRRWSLNEDHGE
jgi:hypothetical protein